MNKLAGCAGIILLLANCNSKKNEIVKSPYQWPANIAAPVCEKRAKELVQHGDKRVDDYFWLNGYFYKNADSTKIIEYLEAENRYTDTMMAGSAGLQKKLYAEMRGRIKEKDESAPYLSNGYYYYSRVVEGKDYYVYCRKKGSTDAPEEVLLDVNAMAEGHGYFNVGGLNVSPDNKLLAYGVDSTGRRQYVIHIKNLETGEILPDRVDGTPGYATWANDNQTFFYVLNNPTTLLGEKIKKHKLGTANDAVVYEEKDPSNYIGVRRTLSGKYIFINSSATLSSESRFISADQPDAAFVLFQPRMKEVLYSVSHHENRFIITTNKDAKNFRVLTCPLDKTGADNWVEMIPHRADVLVSYVQPFKNFLVISERKNGLEQIRVQQADGSGDHYITFDETAYSAGLGANAEYTADFVRFNYTSLITPNSEYDYDMKNRTRKLVKQQEVVGGYDKGEYATERLWAPMKDGVKVPVSIVYKKGLVKDGNAPCLLYGYGSYGITMDPVFGSSLLSLLDRGFVYAIAHIRGGEDLGRAWYDDGKMMKKINTFNDFIGVAEYLIEQKFTSPKHLYARGGSAGGLLMGAIVNMRPDLWNGIVADVPFVDVISTMNDTNIPLTTNEYDEWGNPANKEHYDYMKSYSPYDNVTAKNYPNMLVTTGLHDSQVQYFEPAKWVAKLRAMKTDKNQLLFKTNMAAGHGGASGRFKYLEETALRYAFFLNLEGIAG
ncbi:MAG: S9 family peptidase [Dinghuibacter sp.]|nr:S9 family peptidase [Dinghuibacter sp.]